MEELFFLLFIVLCFVERMIVWRFAGRSTAFDNGVKKRFGNRSDLGVECIKCFLVRRYGNTNSLERIPSTTEPLGRTLQGTAGASLSFNFQGKFCTNEIHGVFFNFEVDFFSLFFVLIVLEGEVIFLFC